MRPRVTRSRLVNHPHRVGFGATRSRGRRRLRGWLRASARQDVESAGRREGRVQRWVAVRGRPGDERRLQLGGSRRRGRGRLRLDVELRGSHASVRPSAALIDRCAWGASASAVRLADRATRLRSTGISSVSSRGSDAPASSSPLTSWVPKTRLSLRPRVMSTYSSLRLVDGALAEVDTSCVAPCTAYEVRAYARSMPPSDRSNVGRVQVMTPALVAMSISSSSGVFSVTRMSMICPVVPLRIQPLRSLAGWIERSP